MNPKDIERALRGEPELTPSIDFAARVMRGVWREAETRQAIPFPWKRLLLGLAACAALTSAGGSVLWLRGEALPPVMDSQAIAAAAERSGLLPALTWVPTVLAISYGLAWGSLRLSRLRR